MDCSTPIFPVFHYSLEFAQTHVHWVSDAIQPSSSLLPTSLPAFNLSQHQGLFQWVGSSHQVAKVLKLQPYAYTKFKAYICGLKLNLRPEQLPPILVLKLWFPLYFMLPHTVYFRVSVSRFQDQHWRSLEGGPLIPLILFSISLALCPLCFPQLSHHDPSHVITNAAFLYVFSRTLCPLLGGHSILFAFLQVLKQAIDF